MPQSAVRDVRPFSRDRLFLVPRDEVAKGAMALLDKNQQEAPEIQMASVAMLFAAWCRRLRVSPHEMHELGLKLVAPQDFHHKGNIQAEVLRDFAGIRMAGDATVDER